MWPESEFGQHCLAVADRQLTAAACAGRKGSTRGEAVEYGGRCRVREHPAAEGRCRVTLASAASHRRAAAPRRQSTAELSLLAPQRRGRPAGPDITPAGRPIGAPAAPVPPAAKHSHRSIFQVESTRRMQDPGP
jgi:hypothetical protein